MISREPARRASSDAQRGTGLASMLVIGGVCGLAWAAGLRGLMAEVAPTGSHVEWVGTFAWILAPGVLVGVLLGWAEQLRRTGGRRGWRWLALAPLLFAGVVFSSPGAMRALLEDGIGGGALAVPLAGMLAGHALSGRGPVWGRVISGVVALVPIPVWVLVAPSVGGPALAVTTPRGAWVALYFWSFLAVLGFGCAIPHRPVVSPDDAPPLVTTRSRIDPAEAGTADRSPASAMDPGRASAPARHRARRSPSRRTGFAPRREQGSRSRGGLPN